MAVPTRWLLTLPLLPLVLSGCSGHLFSGLPKIDRTRPIAKVEFRGHPPRLAATTSEGIVFLNEDKLEGPCRVHYFLGPTLLIEDGEIDGFGGPYSVAEIDLKTQRVPVLTREPLPSDQLVALVFEGPDDADWVEVEFANLPEAQGYVLKWPGKALPLGTPIFRIREGRNAGDLQFVGLARGLARLRRGARTETFITMTGPSHMRAALAAPKAMFRPRQVKHRPDDITVIKQR